MFPQLKLEDYKDRLKRGETLNQDQLVSFRDQLVSMTNAAVVYKVT